MKFEFEISYSHITQVAQFLMMNMILMWQCISICTKCNSCHKDLAWFSTSLNLFWLTFKIVYFHSCCFGVDFLECLNHSIFLYNNIWILYHQRVKIFYNYTFIDKQHTNTLLTYNQNATHHNCKMTKLQMTFTQLFIFKVRRMRYIEAEFHNL